MRKLMIMLAVIIFAGTSAFAQSVSADKVPAAVKQAFLKKYPKATEAKWEMEKKNYEVNYNLNGKKQSSNFDANGKWLETEIEIKYEALPQAVKTTLKDYTNGYKVGEVNKVETADASLMYEINVSNTNEEFEFFFNKEGNLMKRKIIRPAGMEKE